MKIYIISDAEIEFINEIKVKLVTSIIHYESTDVEGQTVRLEDLDWTPERALTELTSGGAIEGIPGISLVKQRYWPDGKIETVQQLDIDVTAAYDLYMHFKEIDTTNPDRLI